MIIQPGWGLERGEDCGPIRKLTDSGTEREKIHLNSAYHGCTLLYIIHIKHEEYSAISRTHYGSVY